MKRLNLVKNNHNIPLRSFRELCDEFKISPMKLRSMMRNDPNHPKPLLVHQSMSAGSNSWYDPIKFRQWFSGVNKS